MNVCFFEDKQAVHFSPLTLTRPLCDLRLGIRTIAEKWLLRLNTEEYFVITQPHLKNIFTNPPNQKDSFLFINSRFLPDPKLLNIVQEMQSGDTVLFNNNLIACKCTLAKFREVSADSANLPSSAVKECSGTTEIKFLWDLLNLNGSQINEDLKHEHLQKYSEIDPVPGISVVNPEQVFIGENVKIEPGVVLIAEQGPVVISDNSKILAGSMIRGPVAICEQATVNMGSKISSATTIGPVCKVGGEISNSVFHSYSNKGHEGFVGNSLIGQWVNLGADTNTSNLKNNYSHVRLTDWQTREQIDTGQQFLGAILADHTKTSINTMLNTGTVCGVSSNIFSSGFPPKFIPSFSWLGDHGMETYRFEKAVEAMQAMMKRRNVDLSDEYKQMMRSVFENSSQ